MSLTTPSSIAEIIQITMPRGRSGNGADVADDADDARPTLVVNTGDLPKVAKQLRDIIAESGQFFDRGGPARIVPVANEKVPTVVRLNACGVVRAAHQLCRPVNMDGKP